jgi:hypothetical protein
MLLIWKGFYKFNTSLLLDDKFIENLQKLIQEKETLYNNENINPTLIWELIKSDIRGYAIKYSSEIKKQETEVIKDKERELNSCDVTKPNRNQVYIVYWGIFVSTNIFFSIGLRILQMSIKSFLSMN